jgi:benzoate-CoA ligase
MNNINFAQTIIESSQNYPDKFAYRDGYTDLIYSELCVRIRQVSNGLRQLGLDKGDAVVLVMEDTVDWPVTFLACVYSGFVPVTMSVRLPHDLFWRIAEFVDAKLVVVDDSVARGFTDHTPIAVITREQDIHGFYSLSDIVEPVYVHLDAPGYMGLSSGTTGIPKVAVQRHAMFYEGLKIGPKSYNITADSIMMSIPKMSWGFGLHNSITYTVGLGATSILIPRVPAPSVVYDYLHRFQPTIVTCGTGLVKRLLTKDAVMPASVRCFAQGGEVLPNEVYEEFLVRFGFAPDTVIGMLEVGNINYASTVNSHERGTVGTPLEGVEVRVLNDQGASCAVGEVGELYIKSPMNAFYYYNNYARTRETFVGDWVRTGDFVHWNSNQRLVFVGRKDDVFKVNNLIVSPVEIELELEKSPLVQSVAIAGIDNFKGVREVTAFVVPAK